MKVCLSVWLMYPNCTYKTTAYQFHSSKTPSNHHGDQCAQESGGQLFPVLFLLCSHEDLHQRGRHRPQEDQTQAEEVSQWPSDAAVDQRQGVHQR